MIAYQIQPEISNYGFESRSLSALLKPEELTQNKAGRIYKKGRVIFNEGQRADGLYWIRKGKVKLFKTGLEGRDQITQLMKSNDLIGYRELLCNELYSLSAAAIEDSEIFLIPASEFFRSLDKKPTLLMTLFKTINRDLRSAEERMMNLAQKSVRERLADTLLILRDVYGYEENDTTLNVTLSREDLAAITGTVTETVIRLIADFKNEQLIETKSKKIRILNEKMLSRVAN